MTKWHRPTVKSVNCIFRESFQNEKKRKTRRKTDWLQSRGSGVSVRNYLRKILKLHFVVRPRLSPSQIDDKGWRSRILQNSCGPIVPWRYRDAAASRAPAWRPTRPPVADSGGLVASASLRGISYGRRDEEEASKEGPVLLVQLKARAPPQSATQSRQNARGDE